MWREMALRTLDLHKRVWEWDYIHHSHPIFFKPLTILTRLPDFPALFPDLFPPSLSAKMDQDEALFPS